MEAVNPLLASSLDFLKQGDVERAEKEFTEAVSACCKAYGEARSNRSSLRWIQNTKYSNSSRNMCGLPFR